ncbi:hypothetical protein OG259_28635 [Streptomyces sp. NBC_00250]|uniref:hypothetical protein n=1 Tax=Streptomyces sp. NBC_00250 TaxID=2903641 RepID=UPI002E2D82A1|nr:hypothetical protein [Streptomyces sp. NBC_00250]
MTSYFGRSPGNPYRGTEAAIESGFGIGERLANEYGYNVEMAATEVQAAKSLTLELAKDWSGGLSLNFLELTSQLVAVAAVARSSNGEGEVASDLLRDYLQASLELANHFGEP